MALKAELEVIAADGNVYTARSSAAAHSRTLDSS